MTIAEFAMSIGTVAVVLISSLFGAFKYLIQHTRADRKFMEDRLTKVLDDYNQSQQNITNMMVDYSQTSAELLTWLKTKNGHKEGG